MGAEIGQAYAFLAKGGAVMAVLFVASIICVAFIVERFLALRRSKILPPRLMQQMEELARENKIQEVLALARHSDAPVGRIVATALSRMDKGPAKMKEALEGAGRKELIGMERNLDFLSTLAATGPLLGLLGTITGMIRTFMVVRAVGVGDPLKLSGGISEALICTAAGLIVAIPALVAHRYFLHIVDRYVIELETFTDGIFHLISGE